MIKLSLPKCDTFQLKKEKEDAENETYSEICSKFLNVNKADGLKDP